MMEGSLLRDIRSRYIEELKDRYPPEEITHMFHLLTAHFFGFPRTLIAMEPRKELDPSQENLLLGALDRLKQDTPVQYITGKAWFMDLELEVSPSVLIPRPETEELVRWVLESFRDTEKPHRILDIGTGSGCIALGIKSRWQGAEVQAMDLSEAALEVARRNAGTTGLEVLFRQDDIQNPKKGWPVFDLIVSNPPYVPEGDRASMQRHVVEAEPEVALFAPGWDPLGIYRDILRFAAGHSIPGGWLYLEIYEAYGAAVCHLFREAGYGEIELKKDIFGKDRFVRGRSPLKRSARSDQKQRK